MKRNKVLAISLGVLFGTQSVPLETFAVENAEISEETPAENGGGGGLKF